MALREAKCTQLELQHKIPTAYLRAAHGNARPVQDFQSRNATGGCPTSSTKIQMHHRGAPQLPDTDQQGLDGQMRIRQQMFE